MKLFKVATVIQESEPNWRFSFFFFFFLSHGTKCAGEVAAEADNGICGVGVSFNASIGGESNIPCWTLSGSEYIYNYITI